MIFAAQPFAVFFRRFTAVGALLLLGALNVLAVRPDFHERLHADASAADHQCAVVLFSGGVPAPASPQVMEAPVLLPAVELTRATEIVVAALPHDRLPPGRGPPNERS